MFVVSRYLQHCKLGSAHQLHYLSSAVAGMDIDGFGSCFSAG